MLALPVLASGCMLPPQLTFLSYAADGVSLAISGKSVTDHALSIVADRDCALLRVVWNEAMCRDPIEAVAPGATPGAPTVATATAARPRSAQGWRPGGIVDPSYRLRAGGAGLVAGVAELRARDARLEGFSGRTELFALVHDDGALEVFALDPGRAPAGADMHRVVRIEGYAADPGAFIGLRLNGVYYPIDDIRV